MEREIYHHSSKQLYVYLDHLVLKGSIIDKLMC